MNNGDRVHCRGSARTWLQQEAGRRSKMADVPTLRIQDAFQSRREPCICSWQRFESNRSRSWSSSQLATTVSVPTLVLFANLGRARDQLGRLEAPVSASTRAGPALSKARMRYYSRATACARYVKCSRLRMSGLTKPRQLQKIRK